MPFQIGIEFIGETLWIINGDCILIVILQYYDEPTFFHDKLMLEYWHIPCKCWCLWPL